MVNNSEPTEPRGVVVVTFELSDPRYPFVGLSQQANCRVVLERMLPREADKHAEFFSVLGADPDRVLEFAEATDLAQPRLLSEYENGGLFEFVVEGFCPARYLSERGAIPREVISEDGRGRVVAEIPPDVDTPALVDDFLDRHSTAELRVKRTRDSLTPIFTRNEFRQAVSDRLTDRQQEVLQTAYEAGYYDQSGETTGEELGAELGIDASTVSQHLNAAERKLVSILFESDRSDGDITLTGRP